MTYQPPFQLTHALLARCTGIAEVGVWKAANPQVATPQLRRENRIRTVQASLAIEQNTLSLEQVTAVLEGKTVLGPPKEIQEVRNAFAAYDELPNWQPIRLENLLAAHKLLLRGLADDAGRYRQGGVGYYRLLSEADKAADCTEFIAFLLNAIQDALAEAIALSAPDDIAKTRVETQVKTRVKTPEQLLALLAEQPALTLAEAARHLGKATSTIERAAARLRKERAV